MLVETVLILLLASIVIGIVGSMLGIGGGIFLVPIMTLALGIDIKIAAATSLVTIIVTSSTSSYKYLRGDFVNIRLGTLMECFTVLGAVTGAVLVYYLSQSFIETIFGAVLIYAAVYMIRTKDVVCEPIKESDRADPKKARFRGKYLDDCTKQEVEYDVRNLKMGAGASFLAGNLSGLIGVGGGIVVVPAMNAWMGVPMRAAAATSTFMIGVTAVASALVYLSGGYMAPIITAAAAIGIFIGAMIGTRLMPKVTGNRLRVVFGAIIVVISILMFLRAGGVL